MLLCGGADLHGDGAVYRVESGTSARIWRDPWLPNPNHGFVTSDPLPGHEEATVNQLFVPGENRWDYDILVDLFSEEERGQILKIPLSSYGRSDRIYWVHDNKGFYSVRSGYKRLMQEFFQEYPNTMDSFWRTIWNLKIPAKVRNFLWRASQLVLPTADHLRAKRVDIDKLCPVCLQHDESVLHSLVHCTLARRVWDTLGINSSPSLADSFKDWLNIVLSNNKEVRELIGMTCWAIWTNRNEVVWQSRSYTVMKVIANSKGFLHQWREVHQPAATPSRIPKPLDFAKWYPPADGSLKINTDAAIFENQGGAGFGLVIRDSRGSFVAAKIIPVRGITDPLIAEALGVREALSWLKVRFPAVQIIEMDSLLVYNALQKYEVDNSYFGLLIEECRFLALDMPNVKFSWVRRSANQVAHTLAKAASSFHDTIEWSNYSPLFISNVLLADLSNE
ncbi:unnamed protein product [Fraxinus pennsylvanica]|uniref:Uncharacterized protein n=1 Tax=Fraxinus pennsylvanica TaxID=56036 RepID=A0AAD1ZQL4_9LAMI|nr:unnamed protein product [Fraxinus pennsylvanica]